MNIQASDITDIRKFPSYFVFQFNETTYTYYDCASFLDICIWTQRGIQSPRGVLRINRHIPMPETNREEHIAKLLRLSILQ